VFFAVDLANRRCTCRDISSSWFMSGPMVWDGGGPYSLELRARSQLAYLTDPSHDEPVVSTWEHRDSILAPRNSSMTTPTTRSGSAFWAGVVTVDDYLHDASGRHVPVSSLVRNDRVDNAIWPAGGSNRADEEFIVAQIIFPHPKGDDQPPRKRSAARKHRCRSDTESQNDTDLE